VPRIGVCQADSGKTACGPYESSALVSFRAEDKISKENMGTILGAIIGYVLSGIGSPDQRKQKKQSGVANDREADAGRPVGLPVHFVSEVPQL
jgi:hypothetical protein